MAWGGGAARIGIGVWAEGLPTAHSHRCLRGNTKPAVL